MNGNMKVRMRPLIVLAAALVALASGCELVLAPSQVTLEPGCCAGGAGGASTASGTHMGGSDAGAMVCKPGNKRVCYDGPQGTENVGICKAGKQTCNADGSDYGSCEGEVTPMHETCASTADEDCDGRDCVQWAELFGDSAEQQPSATAVDAAGNSYVIGTFFGAIGFPGDPLVSAGGGDVFLAKLDPTGKVVWAAQFGDNGLQAGTAVAVDAMGDVIIGGVTTTSIQVGGSTVPPGLFVAKFSGAGQNIWSKGLGSSPLCNNLAPPSVSSLTTTKDLDVIVAGYFCGTLNFDSGSISSQGGMGQPDAFLAKISGMDGSSSATDGYWAREIGDDAGAFGRAVALDAGGNIFLAGDFAGVLTFGSNTYPSAGGSDIFLARFASNGNATYWVKTFGDANDQFVTGLAVDYLGGPIVVGYFGGTLDFGGGDAIAALGVEHYVFKYDASENYQWAKVFGTTAPSSVTSPVGSVGADASGNAFVAVEFTGTIDLGAGTQTAAGTGVDVFVAKLTSKGSVAWNKTYGDSSAHVPTGVAVTLAGEPLLTGQTQGTIDFGTGPLMSMGGWDGFVVKLSQ